MIIKKIQINDFGVYGGENEFDFSTTPEKTVILCGGTNGAGKTTLFESIMLCFYGKDFDDFIRPKEYDEKISRLFHKNLSTKTTSEFASIAIEFEFAFDGKIQEYQITRTWKNNENKVSEELSIKKMSSALKQYQELDMNVPKKINHFTNNRFEELDSVEKSEWQQFINQLIPKGIAKLFFFDGEKIQSIADEGNENQYLQSSFDTLLGLDIVNQLQKDISLMLYRNSKQNNPNQGEDQDLDYDESEFESILKIYGNLQLKDLSVDYLPLFLKLQKDLKKKIEDKEIEIKSITQNIQDSKKQLHVIEEKFEKIGGKYFSKYREMEKNEDSISSKIIITEKEIRDLCSTELPFSLIPEQLDEIKAQIESDQKIIRSKYEQDILEKYQSKISTLIDSKSFLPEISTELKKSINFEISKIIKQDNNQFNESETFFNFTENDMTKILTLIKNSKKPNIEKIYNLSNSYKIQKNALEKIELVSKITPNDDEIRPLMKEIEKITSVKTRLEEQCDQLEINLFQNKVMLKSMNFKIRICMNKQQEYEKLSKSEKMANDVQTVLDEYSKSLRSTKLSELETNILKGLDLLLHKEDFIEKVRIDHDTFEVILLDSNNDEITKDMLSKGELQIYATALVWALAQTSGRSLPFMIDTPLARLDVEHRDNLIESFFPKTSQQTIILSTDSEINFDYYKKLQPSISKSYVMEFNDAKGKTEVRPGYFFDKKGEMIVEIL